MAETISTGQMMAALKNMCDIIESEKDYLSELDGAIGDGEQVLLLLLAQAAARAPHPDARWHGGEERVGQGVGDVVGLFHGDFAADHQMEIHDFAGTGSARPQVVKADKAAFEAFDKSDNVPA